MSRQSLVSLRGLLIANRYEEASAPALGDDEVRVRRAPAGSALRTLLSLFSSERRVPVGEAVDLLGEPEWQEMIDLGLVLRDGEEAFGGYRISATEGLFVAHDALPPHGPDHVNGVNPAARTLANLTVRRPVATALDLCTGSGYQAMLLARHASKVIATDLLPRALWLTEVNAELNGITNIECRQGSLFDPVEGERFDIVVCNPPFIISPDISYAFRDGGGYADSIAQAVVRGIRSHLAEAGTASVLVNWGVQANEDWPDPVTRWLDGSRCDALLVRFGTSDPLGYAALWNSHLAGSSSSDYGRTLDRWQQYLSDLGFERVVHAGIVLRRRAGMTFTAAFDAPSVPDGNATDQLLRMFAARSFLEGNGRAMGDLRFGRAEGHQLDQRMVFENGSYRIEPATMTLRSHAGVVGTVTASLVPFLLALGNGTVREIAIETAKQMDVDPNVYLDEASQLVRQLFERGLIELLTGS